MTGLEKSGKGTVSRMKDSGQPAEREHEAIRLRPAADIFEDDNALHVVADVPGVTTETLKVEFDNDVLTLEGDIEVDMPERISSSYAEIRGAHYHRQFRLGREVDSDNIRARVHNGVLDLELPKLEAHRRRRIEVTSA